MEVRILARAKRPDPFAFSGQIECFSKRELELRFRIAGNKEDEVLCDVNFAFFLYHPDANCVIAGIQNVGAMSA